MRTALLLSGGMDSIAIAWWKRPEVAITIDYGQLPARAEIAAATAVARRLDIEHHVVKVDCRSLGSGDMAGLSENEHAPASDWWPYRNQMLATFAAMKAISLGVQQLLIGSVLSDGFHRDGTPEFVGALSALLALQEGGMTVSAPAIELSTLELIRLSRVPDTELAWAHSCHKSDVPCGNCRGCNKYFKVLEDLNDGMAGPQESSPEA
ncbi:7-cyano-7-deazaguanine synthase [Hydrogenophaga sp. ANAO-22]|uniref:7-cyano-7-deazaguanine synthase n=1 Tax=Hydrogenophaga sp. ANAO-22 TaxID=3166645 RepID=UPI0036D34DE0